MRRSLFAAVSCLAAAVAPPAASDWVEAALVTRWIVSEARDPISDAVVTEAYLQTTRINGRAFGEDYARFLLVCIEGKSSIMLDWTFRVAGKANLAVEYRFAGLPGRRLNVRYVNRTRQQSNDARDVRQFLADASASDELYVRIGSDAYGGSDAVFAAKAGADMVRRFVAACPNAAS